MSGAGSRDARADEPRWSRGDQILWTYTNPAHPGLYDQRPVTVIADDENHLAVWLESGTRMLHHVLADGSGIRAAADAAIDDIRAWAFPFDSDYPDFQPDPDWPMPDLPAEATWDFDAS